jgi:hypothetical protein
LWYVELGCVVLSQVACLFCPWSVEVEEEDVKEQRTCGTTTSLVYCMVDLLFAMAVYEKRWVDN